MQVVCVLGSPRSGGNSAALARRFTETAARRGAAVCTFELNHLSYRGCQGCYVCKTGPHCDLDDQLAEVLEAVEKADVVVLASPVYFGDVSSQLKAFIDRNFSFLKPDYLTNPEPSRLGNNKKLVFILTQGNPDEAMYADVFPRYETFMKWLGFSETRLIRVCGIGPGRGDSVPEEFLLQAEEIARDLVS